MCRSRQGPFKALPKWHPVAYMVADFDGLHESLALQVVESKFEACPGAGRIQVAAR